MRVLSLRLIVALIVGVTLVSLASSWYEVQAEKDALRRDLERKVETFGESLAGNAESFLQGGDRPGLEQMAQRFNNRDHVLGIGVYDLTLFPLVVTRDLSTVLPDMPPALSEAMERNQSQTSYTQLHFKRLYIFAAPLHAVNKSVAGGMVIVYDTGYIRAEIFRVWSRVFIHIAGLVLVIVAITLLIVRWSLAGPIASAAQWMNALRTARTSTQVPARNLDFFQPLAREMAPLAESMRQARAAAAIEARLRNTNESVWTAERLADHVRTKLNGSNLFVVSNREPYIHNRQGNAITVTVPASGLVTALEPILCACNGTWVAQGSGTADKQTVDEHDRLQVPPDDSRYTLRRVWLTPEEEEGYYYGFANEGLWPLCHMAHTRPNFRASDWEYYNKVNARFADALAEEMAGEEHPVVLIQDYHFALLPRMMKERMPHARVAIFWHIPWPNPEAFSICPWQEELLDGLLGADLIGFHVQAHCNNFLSTVDHVLEAQVDWEHLLSNASITGRRCCRSPSACRFLTPRKHLTTALRPRNAVRCSRNWGSKRPSSAWASIEWTIPKVSSNASGPWRRFWRLIRAIRKSSPLSRSAHPRAVTFSAMQIFKKRLRPRPTVSMSVCSAANGGRLSF